MRPPTPIKAVRGWTYWQILVLAAVRLGCNLDYDKLQNLAEEHRTLRRMMGIGSWQDDDDGAESFDWRRLRANVCLLLAGNLEATQHAGRAGRTSAGAGGGGQASAGIPLWWRPTSTIPRTRTCWPMACGRSCRSRRPWRCYGVCPVGGKASTCSDASNSCCAGSTRRVSQNKAVRRDGGNVLISRC